MGLFLDSGFDGGNGKFASGSAAGVGEDIGDIGSHGCFGEPGLPSYVFVGKGFQQ